MRVRYLRLGTVSVPAMYRGIMLCPAYRVARGVSAIQGFLMYTSNGS